MTLSDDLEWGEAKVNFFWEISIITPKLVDLERRNFLR